MPRHHATACRARCARRQSRTVHVKSGYAKSNFSSWDAKSFLGWVDEGAKCNSTSTGQLAGVAFEEVTQVREGSEGVPSFFTASCRKEKSVCFSTPAET